MGWFKQSLPDGTTGNESRASFAHRLVGRIYILGAIGEYSIKYGVLEKITEKVYTFIEPEQAYQ